MSSTPVVSALRRARSAVLGPSADVAGLQTAAALEATAVLAYEAVLNLPQVAGGDATVRASLVAARDHHASHAAAWNTAALAAGGAPQQLPETELLTAVRARLPAVTAAGDALTVVLLVERTLAATHVARAPVASSAALRAQYVATAAVEAQHIAYLLTAGAAGVDGSGPSLAIRLALPAPRRPTRTSGSRVTLAAAVGAAGCPAAFAPTAGAAAPAAGAAS